MAGLLSLAILTASMPVSHATALTPGDVMVDHDTSALRQAVERGELAKVKEYLEAGATGDTMDFFNPFEPGAAAIAIALGHRSGGLSHFKHLPAGTRRYGAASGCRCRGCGADRAGAEQLRLR